ncbi:MAG: hypothetical protein COA78_00070 [Blastopirellula sp.]|nr:MAG: hypothetical protein COA78_00070 [Blastopirellula sp.]
MHAAKALSKILQSYAGYLVTLLLLAQVIIVALRYVFAVGWPWALDLLVYLFFLSVLLPGLAVLMGNISVRVDIFYGEWGTKRRRFVDRIALFFLFFPAMGYAAWTSLGITINSWEVLESSPTFGGLPGYFLLKTALTLYFTIFAVIAIVLALRKNPYDSEDAS